MENSNIRIYTAREGYELNPYAFILAHKRWVRIVRPNAAALFHFLWSKAIAEFCNDIGITDWSLDITDSGKAIFWINQKGSANPISTLFRKTFKLEIKEDDFRYNTILDNFQEGMGSIFRAESYIENAITDQRYEYIRQECSRASFRKSNPMFDEYGRLLGPSELEAADDSWHITTQSKE